MQSLLVDVNRICNLATKNAFVTHETCRRSWKSLTLLSDEADLQDDGFTERFKFDSTPPRNDVLRRTPSLEDSEYSSSAATMNARVLDDANDATTSNLSACRHCTKFFCTTKPQQRPCCFTYSSWERVEPMSSNLFGPYWQKGEKHRLIVFKRVLMGGWYTFCLVLTTLVLIHLVLWVVTLKHNGRLLLFLQFCVMQR